MIPTRTPLKKYFEKGEVLDALAEQSERSRRVMIALITMKCDDIPLG